MEKYFNTISIIIGTVGGFFCHCLGGWDTLLKAIVAMVILDYLTGVLKGIYRKKLSSEIGFKGILKKIMIFTVITASYVLQKIIGDAIPLREITIMFFIANEGLSLCENAAVMIPMPEKLKDVLLQIRESAEEDEEEKEEKKYDY